MILKIITPPTVEPVTLKEIKAQLRIDVDDEAALLEGYIQAAREDCEDFHGRSYVQRTLEYILDRFPARDRIMLPRPPVQEVISVTYLDRDGVEHTFTDWLPALDGDPAVIRTRSWPSARLYPAGAVRVRYVAGYPAREGRDTDYRANIPWAVKAAVLQTAGTYYEYRENVAGRGHVPMMIPGTAEALLWKTRFFFNEEANR